MGAGWRSNGRGRQRCDCQCHWDWDWLQECFVSNGKPTGITPTDIDTLFVTERHDRFVFVETKYPGEELPTGQERAFEALSKLERCEFWLLKGERNEPQSAWKCQNGVWSNEYSVDRQAIVKATRRWFKTADAASSVGFFCPTNFDAATAAIKKNFTRSALPYLVERLQRELK